LQAKLLRVLQEGEFDPVGSSETKKVDVRVIAATNRNLEDEIKKGKFREDLYYRLNVYPLMVPPLKERGDDIVILALEFVNKYSRKLGMNPPRLTPNSIHRLKEYNWPGNVRELQNIIERSVILSHNGEIELNNILPGNNSPVLVEDSEEYNSKILSQKELLKLERENIIKALNSTGGKISGDNGAAKLLGLPASTLSSRIKALGINKS
jgi:transcriptional regulator with GAF, ATPase, and Fis domain